jgi:hypothetical protein
MLSSFTRRLSYANVMASVAVFLALGGTAYAALKLPANSVGEKQLENGAVTTNKLHADAVGTENIKNGAVTGPKMNFAGVTVPNAHSADTADTANNARFADSADTANTAANANAVDGQTVTTMFFKGTASSGPQTVLNNVNGLTITASCDSSGDVLANASTTASNADLLGNVVDLSTGADFPLSIDYFSSGTPEGLLGPLHTVPAEGHTEYATDAGKVVTLNYASENSPTLNGESVCVFYGTAIAN